MCCCAFTVSPCLQTSFLVSGTDLLSRRATGSQPCAVGGARVTPRCEVGAPVGLVANAPIPQELRLGNLVVSPPVVLAPMAGVTNYPFRKMCAEYGAGLFVSEMLLAKHVAEGKMEGKARFGADEAPRSAQLYGTSPSVMGAAAERLILEQKVDHIDLNFGCPAAKVIRKGGGAAIPADPVKLRKIVSAVTNVASQHDVPVTAKLRLGLDWLSLNYLEAGHIIEDCGAAAVTLHARTASDNYEEGAARRSWFHISALVSDLNIPVLANGDMFTATDALRTVRLTGAAGVVIGRGCLGRPWLFKDLAEAFRTKWSSETTIPEFRVVADTMMEHLTACVAWQAVDGVSEKAAVMSMRKWFGWYWKGYNGLPQLWVPRMCKQTSVAGVRDILAEADPENISYSYKIVAGDRGKYKSMKTPEEFRFREPRMPVRPTKSASQRLPKTQKGRKQRAQREAKKEAEFLAKREEVLEWRRARAEPRRRAKAVNVQKTIASRGVKTGTRPETIPSRQRQKDAPGQARETGKAPSQAASIDRKVDDDPDDCLVDGG